MSVEAFYGTSVLATPSTCVGRACCGIWYATEGLGKHKLVRHLLAQALGIRRPHFRRFCPQPLNAGKSVSSAARTFACRYGVVAGDARCGRATDGHGIQATHRHTVELWPAGRWIHRAGGGWSIWSRAFRRRPVAGRTTMVNLFLCETELRF